MRCQVCKCNNRKDAKFCENCGHILESSNLSAIQNKRKNKKGRRVGSKEVLHGSILKILFTSKSFWIVTTIALGALFIISIVSSNISRNTNSNSNFIDQRSANPLVEAKVYKIASKFVCGCGSCGEEPLDACKCNFAVTERQFIRDYLEDSKDEDEIIDAVNSKYGGLQDGSKQVLNDAAKFLATDAELELNKNNVLARYADQAQIYNSFECPCGQCGIKELSECTCNHERGAIEVKKFIDVQIAKNKFTVDQVIDEVAQVYGGKKN